MIFKIQSKAKCYQSRPPPCLRAASSRPCLLTSGGSRAWPPLCPFRPRHNNGIRIQTWQWIPVLLLVILFMQMWPDVRSRIIGSGLRIWRLNFLSIMFKLGCCGSKICVADKLWPIRGLHFTTCPAKHLLHVLLQAKHLQLKSNAPSYYPCARRCSPSRRCPSSPRWCKPWPGHRRWGK